MLRYLFAFLLLVHGLIHLLGFVKQWHLTTISQMSGKTLIPIAESTSKLLGLGWLLACLGFGLALVGYWLRRDWWLAATFSSIVLSQALIIFYWPDAKAGTIANACIAVVLVLTYAQLHFSRQADEQSRQLLSESALNQEIVTPEMLAGLPTPVQQWLTASGVVGKERVHTVRLRQRGLMRTSPTGAWMHTEAEQYFGVDRPGFVWKANVQMMGFLPLAGHDSYAGGKGRMLIKALSVVPVVDAADAKTDLGAMLRYLSEMCWFPSAALSPYITWQAIDTSHAQATMTDKGMTVKAVFAFDEQHRLGSITANRYYGGGEAGKLESWYIPARAWKTMHGVTIPVKGDVIWKLPAGDFNYFQWEITDIDYNKPMLY
ncbi:MAG: hypothetical protein LH606_09560 [Cytophagaceae bacterium]|nr:hypothetical protein [Cytophagaceae bacterium]